MRSNCWAVLGLTIAMTSPAFAELLFGGGVSATIPGDRLEVKYGSSLALDSSIIYPVHMSSVSFRPSVGVNYSRFSNTRDASRPVWFYRTVVGGDLRYPGFVLKPLIGAHFGYSWGNGKTLNSAYVSGITYDWEVGLDYPLAPHVEVGARLRRVTISADEADDARFWMAGLLAAVTF